ncbi:MAG TPA: DedA family protein [Pseudobacteroides sp.]|uniref:DedA family protein n=1 Tax=Pseudobacteroides sp. TaxID=1968840 RepID=UPI002F95EAE7
MELITQLIDFVIHIDKHLAELMQDYGAWTYLILFLIIFCETGLVVTPFLPGDSLLFVIGALGASGVMDFKLALILLIIAAIGGNTLNYFIGKTIGNRILESTRYKFIRRIVKKEYIDKAHAFYEKHGGKAILLSRFLPILRTFAPFVAGIGKMNFVKFTIYNAVGAIAWVLIFMFGGYFFGNIPVVKNNFTYVIFGIIFVSLLPAIVTAINAKREKTTATLQEE